MAETTTTPDAQPAVLTIAGTDSSGGAGIQADLKTFTAHNCYGASVVVALTAQNTTGVQAVHAPPPEFIEQQLRSVLDDIDIKAIKTGMLHSAASVRAVVRTLEAYYPASSLPPLVCDPVCVSTSGHTLLRPDALAVLVADLLPLTCLLTPNTAEAALLLAVAASPAPDTGPQEAIEDLPSMLAAAPRLRALGPANVLLKGGHLPPARLAAVRRALAADAPHVRVVCDGGLYDGEANMEILHAARTYLSDDDEMEEEEEEEERRNPAVVVDVLETARGTTAFVRPRVASTRTHGTGCTLSAALACALARGESVEDATRLAAAYTHAGIETAPAHVGRGVGGHGPLNHMHALVVRAVPRATKTDRYPFVRLLIASSAPLWKDYVEHPFVRRLAAGTLPMACFLHFIKQDYLYLRYYARAYGLLAAKSTSFAAIEAATDTMRHVVAEVATHVAFCARWGVSEPELLATPESAATTAYGAFLLDCGLQGDAATLTMAAAACLLGYGEVGLWLKREAARADTWVVLAGNPYVQWMEEYAGAQYQAALRLGLEAIEAIAAADPPGPARLAAWKAVWARCTRLEKGFWDMALALA